MKANNFGIVYLIARKIGKAGIFFLFATIFFSLHSRAQSYFYFEDKIPQPGRVSASFFFFLTLQPDGTGTVRIRSANSPLVEQAMADSVFTEKTDSSNVKFLVLVGEPVVFGIGPTPDVKIRFVFKKIIDSTGTYYTPRNTEYADTNGNWQPAENVMSTEKTYETLVQEKAFISFFFDEDDPFYKFLYGERDRVNIGTVRNEKLFLIVVANTNDAKIGATSKKDYNEISETFTTLANNLGMKISSIKISGNQFNKEQVLGALSSLEKQKPSSSDIIIFYYSGHGFRYANDKSSYPRMSLRTSPNQDLSLNNMELEAVYHRIKKLGARVNLVISDCCNEDIGVAPPVGRPVLQTRFSNYNTSAQSLNLANCNALFFSKQPISIIATSAEVKQLAIGNPELGGFFSFYFKAFLDKSLYSFWKNDSWLRLLQDAKESARKQALTAQCGSGRCIQLADFIVDPPR